MDREKLAKLINQKGWHEWLCKSNFSFLCAASHPAELARQAFDNAYAGLALCDYDGVYGLARFYREAKLLEQSLNKEGKTGNAASRPVARPFKLFYGIEFHLAKDHDLPLLLQDTLCLVAMSARGYRYLCELSSYAHRGGKTEANLPFDHLLDSPTDDVAAIVPMRGRIRYGYETDVLYEQRLLMLRDKFPGRLYLAISRHLHSMEDAWIGKVLQLSRRYSIPCLASQDAFFHHPQQKPISDLLHAIRVNEPIDQAMRHYFPNNERCLRNGREIAARYADIPGIERMLQHSQDLAHACHFCLSELRYQYPKEMIPKEFESAQAFLQHLVWQEAPRCYARKNYAKKSRDQEKIPDKVRQLLLKELDLIAKLGFADYFLTVWDIVRWARSQNILCQGRGSAANSAVCYVLGITSVDPSLFELLFERFISMERGDPPDIDVDFEHERREEVIQYIYRRYGRRRAAMVANVITFKRKGALRAVGKALGVREAGLKQVSDLCGSKYFRQSRSEDILREVKMRHEGAVTSSVSHDDIFPGDIFPDNLDWQLWFALAERLKGFPRHLGIHSGGFMLSDKSINHMVGIEPASMEGRSVVQWCKEDIEGLGFFKIDILALGMLSAVRKCLQLINKAYGVSMDFNSIPQEDRATYAMIQKADTVGTFQIESRAQMSMLPRLRPKTFYDLVIEVAIIRPGPIQGKVIHPYLRRREGLDPVTYPDEKLRPILSRTLGVAIFQEQAMRIAMAVGNFTAGEANELRKNIGAWNIKNQIRDLDPWLEKLREGMVKNRMKDDFIEQIIGQMSGFADYGFPESHSISFAFIAYASSYLKCHYPAAFFASVLNSQPMGFYSPHALLQAAQRDGVQVLPVCINHSDWDHTLERVKADTKTGVKAIPGRAGSDFAIRLGFRLVSGLRKEAGEMIAARRAHQESRCYRSFGTLMASVQLFRSDLIALAFARALDCFGLSRAEALWEAHKVDICPFLEDRESVTTWREDRSLEAVEKDFKAFKTTLMDHPCRVIKREHWHYAVPLNRLFLSRDLESMPAGQLVHVFGMSLVKQAPPSAKGMVFITLEDESGYINLVFTPQSFAKMHADVEGASFLCLSGTLQKAHAYHSIMVKTIYPQLADESNVHSMQQKMPQQERQKKNSQQPKQQVGKAPPLKGKGRGTSERSLF